VELELPNELPLALVAHHQGHRLHLVVVQQLLRMLHADGRQVLS
jgi:hypothetical protein